MSSQNFINIRSVMDLPTLPTLGSRVSLKQTPAIKDYKVVGYENGVGAEHLMFDLMRVQSDDGDTKVVPIEELMVAAA